MAGHLQVLLAAIADDPGRLVRQLELATGAERVQLLAGRNDTARPVPAAHARGSCSPPRPARTPDATAVICGRRRLTYAELDRAANRLACQLAALGAGREQPGRGAGRDSPSRSSRCWRSSRPAPPTCPLDTPGPPAAADAAAR